MCVYKLLEQTYTHAHSYICCIFCSTVPHPSKNDVVALVPQRLQPVEHWFHTCSSSSTLQRQVIRIFLVIQINCGQPQAKTFCWDAIDPLASGICPSTRFDKILLLQIGIMAAVEYPASCRMRSKTDRMIYALPLSNAPKTSTLGLSARPHSLLEFCVTQSHRYL